jgi:glutaredoxin
MKTLLIGGLALIQVFFQNEPRLVRFPWASGDTGISDSPLSTWANSDTLAKLKLGIATRSAGKYDQLAVSSELDSLIGLKPLVIFSWRNCPYCQKAIQLIGETDAREFEIIQLDEGFYRGKPGKALRAELGKRTGRTSVPSIWIGGKFVGGCNDGPDGGLVALWGDGREGNALVEMLRKSGAIPARISAVSELELGPWLKEKIGDNGMMFLGLLSVTPYALFFLKALGN